MDRDAVVREAQKQLNEETFQQAVDAEKELIRIKRRNRRWWHAFIPFTFKIERRK